MVPYFQNLTDQQFANKFRAMVFKSGVWGVPIGIFWHWNELTPHQVGLMIDTLKAAGATMMSNTQLVNYLLSTQQNSGRLTRRIRRRGRRICGRRRRLRWWIGERSEGAEYKHDLMGIDQTAFGAGWEMGAYAFVPESTGQVRP